MSPPIKNDLEMGLPSDARAATTLQNLNFADDHVYLERIIKECKSEGIEYKEFDIDAWLTSIISIASVTSVVEETLFPTFQKGFKDLERYQCIVISHISLAAVVHFGQRLKLHPNVFASHLNLVSGSRNFGLVHRPIGKGTDSVTATLWVSSETFSSGMKGALTFIAYGGNSNRRLLILRDYMSPADPDYDAAIKFPGFVENPRRTKDGGLQITQLCEEILSDFMKVNVLHAFIVISQTRRARVLGHLLSLWVWEVNVRRLSHESEKLSEDVIRYPNKATLTRLNEFRITTLRVKKALMEIPKHESLIADLAKHVNTKSLANLREDLVVRCDEMTVESRELYQALVAGITLADSEVGKKQAKRGTMLALLAAIYLPLTLATGIFGMNIDVINGATPHWWAVVVTCVVLLCPSVIFIIWLFVGGA